MDNDKRTHHLSCCQKESDSMVQLTEKEIRTICLMARSKGVNSEFLNKLVKENITYKKIIEKLIAL